MHDERLDKLADVLVRYSVALKKGDLVMIQGEPAAEPLMLAVYKAALAAGAYPQMRMTPEELAEIKLKHASDEQLAYVSPLAVHEVETIDAQIGIWAEMNPRALSNTDPKKHAKMSAARRPVMERFLDRASKKELRWTGTIYPTHALAQEAEMSLTEYEAFVFGAGLLDLDDPVAAWQAIAAKQQKAVDLLNGKKHFRFETVNGTDLTMSLEGRTWINCCGKENFPDGEVFSAPVEDSVNGTIAFSFPAVHMGHECEGVRLTFENGRVVKAQADKGEDFLLKMLDQDDGARSVGEIAIGTNYKIQKFTKNTLFDEKIGGTVHLAAGAAYPETGGKNSSGLHWDMVCDFRPGGRIIADGQTIYENGTFKGIEL